MISSKKNLTRPKKTPEELRNASDALYYEIWMFDEMVKSLSTQSPQFGNPQYNALIESFVQHMRNLLGFFYPTDKVRPDTIIASDFFLTRNQGEKKIQPWLDSERKDSHQFLAHLTYDRMKKDKRWDYPRISKYINEIVEEFLKEVPQDLIREKLKNYKVPSVNIIKSPIDEMVASTTEAVLPGITVTRDLFK